MTGQLMQVMDGLGNAIRRSIEGLHYLETKIERHGHAAASASSFHRHRRLMFGCKGPPLEYELVVPARALQATFFRLDNGMND